MRRVLTILISLVAVIYLSGCTKDGAPNTFVDSDGDGLSDAQEIELGWDPNNPDSDGDGVDDGTEFADGTDGMDPDDFIDHDSSTGTGRDTDSIQPSTDDGPDEECADIRSDIEVKPINLLVLLDRSGSMAANSIGDQTYAEVVQAAVDSVVQQNTESGIINFALNVFPSDENCSNQYRLDHDGVKDSDDTDTNPEPAADFAIACEGASRFEWIGAPTTAPPAGSAFSDPTVPFSETVTEDTYTAISAALDNVGQCGGTPICQSLWWASQYLEAMKLENTAIAENPTYVLLATDGAPSCSHTLDADNCASSMANGADPTFPEQCLDDACSINAALYLASKGFRTYVVGVGEDAEVFENVLDSIAYFGGANGSGCAGLYDPVTNPWAICEPTTRDNWFFPASNSSDLSAALEEITNNTLSCEFEVPWGEVPDFDPVDTDLPVAKACSMVRAKALLPPGMEDTDTTEDTDSSTDTEEDPNKMIYDAACQENKYFGWRWADPGLLGAPWEDVKAETTTDGCTKIQLCPKACEQLQIHNGVRTWESAAASFGCAPVVRIE